MDRTQTLNENIRLFKDIEKNKEIIRNILTVKESFDIIEKILSSVLESFIGFHRWLCQR